MRIDLHTHSDCSDGTDRPGALVTNAAAAGLDVVALTDHDTTVGWEEAQVAADAHGIRLVRGIELSTRNEGVGQHLLGYGVDPKHPSLVGMLDRGVASRDSRVPEFLDRLAGVGIALDLEEVLAAVKPGGVVGRPHIASVLVARGHCADLDEAFATYLTPGTPTYVHRWAPDIENAIAIVLAAGGVPVLAHPRGRRGIVSDLRIEQLTRLGLAGVEVDHQEHDEETRAGLRGLAGDLDLVMTGSSDYHGARKQGHDLGCNLTAPEEFERLMALTRA